MLQWARGDAKMEDRSRILIVDDDPDIRKVLYLLLRES